MNLEYSEEKLNKLKTEFPSIPEVLIKRVLRCHDVAANPESLEIVRKELRGFLGIQTPQRREGVFKKRPSAGQLDYSEETLNKLKTEFHNIPEVFIKRVLRCHDVAANPENLESVRKELRRFQGTQTPQGRGGVFKKPPSAGQREVPIGRSIGERGGDLEIRHFGDHKCTDDAFEEEGKDFADDKIGAQHPEPPGNLNRFVDPPPTKPKPSQGPIRKPQVISTMNIHLNSHKECPPERGACKDNNQKEDKSGFLQQKQVEDDCQLIGECGGDLAGRHFGDHKRTDDAFEEEGGYFADDESDGGQRKEDEHISSATFATGSETERGHDLGDEGREQSMSSVRENQSLCIEKGERFEENKSVVSELSGPMTNEGVLSHTEAMSGHMRTRTPK